MFEDVGTVWLTAGRARVDLDPNVAQKIDTSELIVFLSPRGETAGVYVVSQDAPGLRLCSIATPRPDLARLRSRVPTRPGGGR